MEIGGIQKFSMSDYPGNLSAILFTIGCNFCCPYCHNPELVLPDQYVEPIDLDKIFAFLKDRLGQLDGVVITGGEPTLHSDLPQFVQKIRNMGYVVKLDTNGTHPEMLQKLIEEKLVNYIAMDYKSPAYKYSKIVGLEHNENIDLDIQKIKNSLEILKNTSIEYEIRTTIVKKYLDNDDIVQIRREVGEVQHHYFQEFNPEKTLDPELGEDEYNIENVKGMEEFQKESNVSFR